jgi:imidazolonepropionase-like amidohydrolase
VLKDSGRQAVLFDDNLLPVSSDVGLQANAANGAVHLSWHAQHPGATSVFFRVLRAKSSTDVSCAGTRAADQCQLYTESVAVTRAGSYDDRPGPGTFTYRVGVSANWLDDPRLGDVYVVSPPLTVTVP